MLKGRASGCELLWREGDSSRKGQSVGGEWRWVGLEGTLQTVIPSVQSIGWTKEERETARPYRMWWCRGDGLTVRKCHILMPRIANYTHSSYPTTLLSLKCALKASGHKCIQIFLNECPKYSTVVHLLSIWTHLSILHSFIVNSEAFAVETLEWENSALWERLRE